MPVRRAKISVDAAPSVWMAFDVFFQASARHPYACHCCLAVVKLAVSLPIQVTGCAPAVVMFICGSLGASLFDRDGYCSFFGSCASSCACSSGWANPLTVYR